MAQLLSDFGFTGSLGKLSAYKMRGVDKTILRTRGGASKQKIKSHPNFEIVRRNNSEFGGCANAGKWIRLMLGAQTAVADYNIAGPINALVKPIQVLDTVTPQGQRNIELSKNPRLLEGFNLNRKNIFDSIIRTPVLYTISKETLSIHVELPPLMPGINFFAPGKYALCSFVAVLGIVPDLYPTVMGYKPKPEGYSEIYPATAETPWYPVLEGSAVSVLDIRYPKTFPDKAFSMMLSIGIRFGTMGIGGAVQQIKYAGAAKILAMA